MRYQVKQDYPKKVNERIFVIPKGTIVENNIASFNTHKVNISNKELEVLTDWFEKIEEPKFRAGDWVKYSFYSMGKGAEDKIFRIVKVDNRNGRVYENDWASYEIAHLVKATFEEIETHLTEEAIRRGFVIGTKYFSACKIPGIKQVNGSLKYCCDYNLPGVLTDGWGGSVYYGGEWAQIVKDDPITIGSYKVEFLGDDNCRDGKPHRIKVGCKTYLGARASQIYSMMREHNINAIEIEGVKVPFETVKKIAERFQ